MGGGVMHSIDLIDNFNDLLFRLFVPSS